MGLSTVKFFIFFILFVTHLAFCQDVLNVKIAPSETGKTLEALLTELEQRYNVHFYFRSDWIDNINLPDISHEKPLYEVFEMLFQNSDLGYIEMQPGSIIIVKDPTQAIRLLAALQAASLDKRKIEVI